MSESSSYRSYESEDEPSSRWTPDNSTNDEESDELTLLNGDGESDQDSTTFEAFIKLSMRLKEKYNLREASVSLERCDKIWDTMQLLKKMQTDRNYGSNVLMDDGNIENEDENDNDDNDDDNDDDYVDDDDDDNGPTKSMTDAEKSESTSSSIIPYIKYQPVQGNGNNALPNFYLSVKSQKKVYHCVTCGRQFIERRALRRHTLRDHGIVLPCLSDVPPKRQITGEPRVTRSKTPQNIENRESQDSNESKISSQDSLSYAEWKKKRDSSLALSRCTSDDVSKEKPFNCPQCSVSYSHSRTLRHHVIQIHGYDVAIEMGFHENLEKKPIEKKDKEDPNVKNIEEIRPDGTKILHGWRKRVKNGPYVQPLVYQCGTCRRDFCDLKTLRKHRLKIHNVVLPLNRSPNLKISNEPKSEHKSKNDKSLARENPSKKSKKSKTIEKKEIPRSPIRGPTTRAGPKSSKRSIARPKRACTVNTSYTECTKEEEEVLQREIFSMKSSEKSLPSQQTKCVLCKRTFVDIRTHLKDYHRINSPDSVLTFTDKISSRNENEAVATSNTTEQTAEDEKIAPSIGTSSSIDKRDELVTSSVDKKEIVTSPRIDDKSKKPFHTIKWDEEFGNYVFQCNVCLYKYSSLRTIQRHHSKFLQNGVMKPHEATKFVRVRIPGTDKFTYRNNMDLLQDPLALTNWPDNDDNASDSTISEALKRRASSSDERSSPIFPLFTAKRRKIIDSETSDDLNNGSEITNDSSHENNDRIMNKTQTDFRTNDDDDDDDEAKTTNSRDTRDSSDRDSGIGISITIKKRNNSYEVVEKDIHDDDDDDDDNNKKIKTGYAIATSLITPDCTSYTITNVEDYFNKNERVPRVGREIFDPLDCSVERDNVTMTTTMTTTTTTTTTTQMTMMMEETTKTGMRINDKIKDDDEDIAIIADDDDDDDYYDVNCTDNDNNYSGSNDECYSDEACANMPGKVHSLKVLCRNVLRGGRISHFMSKDKFTHQCPVCCRFYPTERDVTVHMLQHKVPRTSFRTTRLHGIPSSSLRRYGRRKTFE